MQNVKVEPFADVNKDRTSTVTGTDVKPDIVTTKRNLINYLGVNTLAKKHHRAIARIIKQNRQKNDTASWLMIVRLADYFEIDDSRFNRQEFIKACL